MYVVPVALKKFLPVKFSLRHAIFDPIQLNLELVRMRGEQSELEKVLDSKVRHHLVVHNMFVALK